MAKNDVAKLMNESRDGLSRISREFVKDAGADEIAAAFADVLGEVESTDDYLGDGVALVQKDDLVGKPFFIYDWQFSVGDLGQYVTVRAVLPSDEKVVFSDGSTGICRQLMEITSARQKAGKPIAGGLLCKRGLRRSDYAADPENGRPSAGTTYYLA